MLMFYNIVIAKLVETKSNSKYLIGYLDEAMRTLVLILPKMSRFAKTFKLKGGYKNNKLMAIDDDKLLKKYNTIDKYWIEWFTSPWW